MTKNGLFRRFRTKTGSYIINYYYLLIFVLDSTFLAYNLKVLLRVLYYLYYLGSVYKCWELCRRCGMVQKSIFLFSGVLFFFNFFFVLWCWGIGRIVQPGTPVFHLCFKIDRKMVTRTHSTTCSNNLLCSSLDGLAML